jgi:hypothetical protein
MTRRFSLNALVGGSAVAAVAKSTTEQPAVTPMAEITSPPGPIVITAAELKEFVRLNNQLSGYVYYIRCKVQAGGIIEAGSPLGLSTHGWKDIDPLEGPEDYDWAEYFGLGVRPWKDFSFEAYLEQLYPDDPYGRLVLPEGCVMPADLMAHEAAKDKARAEEIKKRQEKNKWERESAATA